MNSLCEIWRVSLNLFLYTTATITITYNNYTSSSSSISRRLRSRLMKTMNVIVAVLAVAVVLLHGAEAVLYTVGDDLGWAIPPGGAATYSAWAAEHSFVVNDELEFDFAEGEQDLALVTKDDYESCNTADPLYVFQEAVTLQFLASDTFYFTSTLAGHCTKGQKIAIYIGAALPPSPSPAPGPCPYSTYSSSANENRPQSTKFVSHKIMARGN